MHEFTVREQIELLSRHVTEKRQRRMQEVLELRTRRVTLVLEDIYQSHNASATIRSCDLFGIQEVHVIENRNRYTINPDISLGSTQWVDLVRWKQPDTDNSAACIQHLKERGYLIAATTPRESGIDLHEFPIDRPIALLFGTELTGLSETALNLADNFLRIPMYGFTESFNISVSVALSLYELVGRIRRSGDSIFLDEEEKKAILLRWLKTSLAKPEAILNRYWSERPK